jgi:hypothetical protein
MTPSLRFSLALLLAATAGFAAAASSTSSAVSDSIGMSVGSVSESFRGSSNASSGGTRTAAGEFRIVEVALLVERPGRVQLTLEPLVAGDAQPLTLELPQPTVARAALDTGSVIAARPRPYGVEFAVAQTGRAFFLVLDDEWYRGLASRAVTL